MDEEIDLNKYIEEQKQLAHENVDSKINNIADDAREEVMDIPDILYHSTRASAIPKIIKDGYLHPVTRNVVSLSKYPLRSCSIPYATIAIELKKPTTACLVPVYYTTKHPSLWNIYVAEKTKALRETQEPCKNISLRTVDRETLDDRYIAEEEIAALCLNEKGEKDSDGKPCLKIEKKDILRLIPECNISKEELINALQKEGLHDLIDRIK